MRVLDANFLIDYLNGVDATEVYYEANGGVDQHWIMPAPAHGEALVGVGNLPSGDVEEVIDALGGARCTQSTRSCPWRLRVSLTRSVHRDRI